MRATKKQVVCDMCGKGLPDRAVFRRGPHDHDMIVVSVPFSPGIRHYHDFCSFACVGEWLKKQKDI